MEQRFVGRHRAVVTMLMVLCVYSVTKAGQRQQGLFNGAAVHCLVAAGDQYVSHSMCSPSESESGRQCLPAGTRGFLEGELSDDGSAVYSPSYARQSHPWSYGRPGPP